VRPLKLRSVEPISSRERESFLRSDHVLHQFVTPVTEERFRILLAEDDRVGRRLLTRILNNAGYEVDAVADGRAALGQMTERYHPILVTDWEMPEMDGIALCKAVREMPLGKLCTGDCASGK